MVITRVNKETPSSENSNDESYRPRTPLVPLNSNQRAPSRWQSRLQEGSTSEIFLSTANRGVSVNFHSENLIRADDIQKLVQKNSNSGSVTNSEFLTMSSCTQSRPCSSPVDEVDLIVPGEESGLPTAFTTEYAAFVPRSRKNSPAFTDIKENDDEDNFNEEPVDYTKRYTTEDGLSAKYSKLAIDDTQESDKVTISTTTEHEVEADEKPRKNIFGNYAETDLDQPTDYSLRYAEDGAEDEAKTNTRYFAGGGDLEDTVMTFYTEGTPYETPFNFSNSTSMSDLLRIDDNKESEAIATTSKGLDVKIETSDKHEELLDLNEDSPVNSVNISKACPDEKPVLDETETKTCNENEQLSPHKAATKCDKDKEGKVVTFGGADHYTQETPLMFSRCSSLGSLSGFEQHSITDDRSSIISDFSRRTSEVVSPSELPDSPTQIVPPSPKQKRKMGEFVAKRKLMFENKGRATGKAERQEEIAYCKLSLVKCSIFEDDVAAFKDESTPARMFSAAASTLSSLTIDDDNDDRIDSEFVMKVLASSISKSCQTPDEFNTNYLPISKTKPLSPNTAEQMLTVPESTPAIQDNVSDSDEDDEGILAACINMGMQTNRYRQPFKICRNDDSNDNLIDLSSSSPSPSPSPSSKPIQYDGGSSPVQGPKDSMVQETPLSPRSPPAKNNLRPDSKLPGGGAVTVPPDTMYIYYTEDTPAYISPYGSQSNFSALSISSIADEVEENELEEDDDGACQSLDQSAEQKHLNNTVELSDDSSNFSGDDDKVPDECINFGMPENRQSSIPMVREIAPTSCIPIAAGVAQNSSERLCGTPSSSPVDSLSAHPGNERLFHSNKTLTFQMPNSTTAECDNGNVHSDDSDSRAHSEDEAILESCIKSAMPKAIRLDSSMSARKSPPSNLDQWRTGMRLTTSPKSPKRCGNDPYFVDTEDDEEDMMLAQCIRSGMPKPLNVWIPPPQMPSSTRMRQIPQQQQRYKPHHHHHSATTAPADRSLALLRQNLQQKQISATVASQNSQKSVEMLRRLHYHMQNVQHSIKDEVIEYEVEDTPCNTSIISELSSLSFNTSDGKGSN